MEMEWFTKQERIQKRLWSEWEHQLLWIELSYPCRKRDIAVLEPFPSKSECDFIWDQSLYKGDQGKVKSLGWVLIQYEWYSYKKQESEHTDRQGEDGHVTIKEHQGVLGARKGKEGVSHRACRDSTAVHAFWFRISRDQNYEAINCYCFKTCKFGYFLTAALCSVAQFCPSIFGPKDCSPPSSSVCWIPQARVLEWVAISFSRGSSWPRDQTCVSCVSCIAGRFFTTEPLGSPKPQP